MTNEIFLRLSRVTPPYGVILLQSQCCSLFFVSPDQKEKLACCRRKTQEGLVIVFHICDVLKIKTVHYYLKMPEAMISLCNISSLSFRVGALPISNCNLTESTISAMSKETKANRFSASVITVDKIDSVAKAFIGLQKNNEEVCARGMTLRCARH